MLPRESRYPRGDRRARRQTDVSALESLEERTLLSFSTLGYSLPDLAISGEAGPRAAWGGTIDVSVYLQNIGASTTTEPLSQLPPTEPQATGSLYNSTSRPMRPIPPIEVLLTKSPKSLKGAVTLGYVRGAAAVSEQRGTAQRRVHAPVPAQGVRGSGR